MIAVLDQLNERQYQAAVNFEGSSLVLAGPGTGKTELMSRRIAAMLISDSQITPQMILALTYTEAGVVALRKRLVKTIGIDAYKLNIATFHSFCNEIIQNNPDYFGIREFEPVSQLEQIQIVQQMIDELPKDNALKRLRGDVYYETRRMLNFFGMMKEENWDAVQVKKAANQYINDLYLDENFIYKRANAKKGIKIGDPKQHLIDAEMEKMAKVVAAGQLFNLYNQRLREKQRYDFADMIHWVLEAFKSDQYFLFNYQEKYQYLMIDEFQDTNGSQLELVKMVMSFWDNANVFAVGDPDQCLYEFNGARLKNIQDFGRFFKPSTIVLNENYRSHQRILTTAHQIIVNNTQRLPIGDLTMPLTALSNVPLKGLKVYHCANTMAETAFVIERVKGLIKRGVSPSDIAVLYRKHRLADELIQQLKAEDIPFNISRSINVLDTVEVKQMLGVLQYIALFNEMRGAQAVEGKLVEILHYRCLGNDLKKVHSYYLNLQDSDFKSRKPKDILRTEALLGELVNKSHNQSIVQLMFAIINDTGMLEHILRSKGRMQALTNVSTFFNWVKEQAFRDRNLTAQGLTRMIRLMDENGLYLPVIDMHSFHEGVNLSTAHGAKGLEWDHVIIMGVNRNEWEGSRTPPTSFTLPPTLINSTDTDKEESNRRLFYVAMTRARSGCMITYADANANGKDLEKSQFIDESGLEVNEGQVQEKVQYFRNSMFSLDSIVEVEKEVVKKRLETFTLSVSSMNKYLKCPLSFYYENILLIPFVATPALIFGNAVHVALKKAYDAVKGKMSVNQEQFVKPFLDYLDKNRGQLDDAEYERRRLYGLQVLGKYFQTEWQHSNKVTLNEFKVRRILINGIPFKGDIDKMEFDGKMVTVVDYKTGNVDSTKKKMQSADDRQDGGDIWRQLVIYKMFIDNLPARDWRFKASAVDMLDHNGCTRLSMDILAEHETFVAKQIRDVHENIMGMQFDGCGDPECYWCNFQKTVQP